MILKMPPNKMISNQEILDKVDMASMLVDIGFSDIDPQAEEQLTFCIFHNDSGTRSFSVNLEKKIFNCFSSACGVHGNAIHLYALWKQITFEQARNELQFLPSRRSITALKEALMARSDTITALKRLDILTKYAEAMPMLSASPAGQYVRNRGITDVTMDRFGLRAYDEEKAAQFDGLTLFQAGLANVWHRPIHAKHPILFPFILGKNVAFIQGRKIDDDIDRPKYLGCRGSIPCLFNHDALSLRPKKVYITEGVMDALSLEQMGYGPALGIVGTEGMKLDWISDFRYVEEVVLAMDHDAAGDAAVKGIADMFLLPRKKVTRLEFPAVYKDVNAWLMGGQA